MGNILSKLCSCFENESEITIGLLDDSNVSDQLSVDANISDQISELFQFLNDYDGQFDSSDEDELEPEPEPFLNFGQLSDSDNEIELPIEQGIDVSDNDSVNDEQIVQGFEEFPELEWDEFPNFQDEINPLNRQQG